MQYNYVAYNLEEGVVRGRVEAHDEDEVRSEVVKDGYKLLRVGAAWQPASKEKLFPSLYKVKSGELIRFSRQLATMVSNGASLQRTLELLRAEIRNPVMLRVVGDIQRDVDEGDTVSGAMAKHPAVFDPLFLSVVQVGETTGNMAGALTELADMMERGSEAKSRVMKTMMLPMINMVMAAGMLFLNIFVIMPPIFESFDEADIPLLIKVSNGVKGFLFGHPIHVFAFVAALITAMKLSSKSPKLSYLKDRLKAQAPVLGPLIVYGELSSFSRTVGMMVESGVSVAESLELGISATKNMAMRRAFEDAQEALVGGESMAQALRLHSILPRMCDRVGVGRRGE